MRCEEEAGRSDGTRGDQKGGECQTEAAGKKEGQKVQFGRAGFKRSKVGLLEAGVGGGECQKTRQRAIKDCVL